MEIYKELLSLSTPIIGMFALFIFQKMSDSVTKLNENVAVVINQVERQGSDINESKIVTARHAEDMALLKLELAKKGIL